MSTHKMIISYTNSNVIIDFNTFGPKINNMTIWGPFVVCMHLPICIWFKYVHCTLKRFKMIIVGIVSKQLRRFGTQILGNFLFWFYFHRTFRLVCPPHILNLLIICFLFFFISLPWIFLRFLFSVIVAQ